MREQNPPKILVFLPIDGHDAANHIRFPAGHLSNLGGVRPCLDNDRPISIVKQVWLTLDFLDVGMATHHPEGIIALRLSHIERRLGSNLTEDRIDPVSISISPTINNGVG
jgi:hypothetical protein